MGRLAEQFISSFSFKDSDKRLTEALHAIKRVLLTSGQLWDGCINQKILQAFYEFGYLEAMACGKVDKEPDEDDLEGL